MRLSASKLGLASNCLAWVSHPQAHDHPSYESRIGSAFHAAIEARVGGREPAWDAIVEAYALTARMLERAQELDRSMLAAGIPRGESEVSFAFDPLALTSREIGKSLSRGARDARLLAHEIGGTADLVDVTEAGDVTIDDFKTGWRHPGDPNEAWQLRGLAVMAAQSYGATRARVGFIRVRPEGVTFARAWFTEAELAAFALQIASFHASIEVAKPTPGAWCDRGFCPARAHCTEYKPT